MATLDNRAFNQSVAGKQINLTTGARELLGDVTAIARNEQQKNVFYTKRFELDITGVATGDAALFRDDTGVIGIPLALRSTTLVGIKLSIYNVTDNTSAVYTGNLAASRNAAGVSAPITLPAGIPVGTLAPAASPAVGSVAFGVNVPGNRVDIGITGLANKQIIATATVEVQSVAVV